MNEYVTRHSAIMDRYDPDHRVGLIVDEWGSWHQVEEGTNPGFLYQQNTMRDAVLAALHLNIFNRHCDRVVMANLAQTVNVLQSVILTEGEKMVLTPTYHVFDLYKVHQDAALADCFVETDRVGEGDWQVDRLTASASVKDGVTTLTVANLSMDEAAETEIRVPNTGRIAARILTGEAAQYNDFDRDALHIEDFDAFAVRDGAIALTLPPCSVLALTIA